MKRDGQPNRPPNWKKRRSTATGPIIALHALQNKTTGAPHCSRGVERSAAAAGRSAHWRSPLRDAAYPRQALAFCGHHPRRRRGTCSHPPCSTVHGTKVLLLPPRAAAMAMASCRVKMTGDWRKTDARTASAITSRIDSLRGRHRHSSECSSTITGGLDRSSDGGSKRHGPGGDTDADADASQASQEHILLAVVGMDWFGSPRDRTLVPVRNKIADKTGGK
jgi:hypothetical protein